MNLTSKNVIDLKPNRCYHACTWCRQKKTKCDGNSPCGRCTSNQRECVYKTLQKRGPKRTKRDRQGYEISVVERRSRIEDPEGLVTNDQYTTPPSLALRAFIPQSPPNFLSSVTSSINSFIEQYQDGHRKFFELNDIATANEVWVNVREERDVCFREGWTKIFQYLRYSIVFSSVLFIQNEDPTPFDIVILGIIRLIKQFDIPKVLLSYAFRYISWIRVHFKLEGISKEIRNEVYEEIETTPMERIKEGLNLDLISKHGLHSLMAMTRPLDTLYHLERMEKMEPFVDLSLVFMARMSLLEFWTSKIVQQGNAFLFENGLSEDLCWYHLLILEKHLNSPLGRDTISSEWRERYWGMIYAKYAFLYSYHDSPSKSMYYVGQFLSLKISKPGKWVVLQLPLLLGPCAKYQCHEFTKEIQKQYGLFSPTTVFLQMPLKMSSFVDNPEMHQTLCTKYDNFENSSNPNPVQFTNPVNPPVTTNQSLEGEFVFVDMEKPEAVGYGNIN